MIALKVVALFASILYLWVAFLVHAFLFFNRPGCWGSWLLAVLQGAVWPACLVCWIKADRRKHEQIARLVPPLREGSP